MGRFKTAYQNMTVQLGGLPLAGKLLVASVGVIVVMALLLVAAQSSKKSYVELMPGAPPEEQARGDKVLDKFDIPHTYANGKLAVTMENQRRALAMLGQEGCLPKDTRFMFETLLGQSNWMDSRGQMDYKQSKALENELAMILSEYEGVESARVLMDAPEPMGLGVSVRRPTASVSVRMKRGFTMNRETVDAIACLVSGAKAGLSTSDVKVIDAGTKRQYTPRSAGDARTSDYLEHVAKIEERVQAKLLEALGYIGNVTIAVTAQADITRRNSTTVKTLPIGEGSLTVKRSESENEGNNSTVNTPAEAGLGSNTTASINTGAGGEGQKSTTAMNKVEFQSVFGTTREEVVDPRGMPTKVSVMIALPREYIAALVKQDKAASGGEKPAAPDAKDAKEGEPTQAEIETKFATERDRLERDLVGIVRDAAQQSGVAAADGSEKCLRVSLIPVPLSVAALAGSALGSTAGGIGEMGGMGSIGELMNSGMIRTAGLGVAAAVGLGMMLMLVRKAGKPIELPSAAEIVGLPPALQTQQDLVGEADETQSAMDGIELDDDEIRHKKMLDQVQELVKKKPGDAATLLNRWVQTET
ncbi:hypothetical protein BH11PLA1_BH11PLA1_08930 [soil metagenome]